MFGSRLDGDSKFSADFLQRHALGQQSHNFVLALRDAFHLLQRNGPQAPLVVELCVAFNRGTNHSQKVAWVKALFNEIKHAIVECRVTGSCIRMTRDHDDRHLDLDFAVLRGVEDPSFLASSSPPRYSRASVA